MCVYVCSIISDSLWSHGLWPTRLLCPWNFPGKNTGVGCHVPLQGIFLTRDWTHVFCVSCTGRQILYHWATTESLYSSYSFFIWFLTCGWLNDNSILEMVFLLGSLNPAQVWFSTISLATFFQSSWLELPLFKCWNSLRCSPKFPLLPSCFNSDIFADNSQKWFLALISLLSSTA